MIRKPIFTFKDTTEQDIHLVPLNAIILIEDAGSGKPNLIQITDMTGITASTTISQLLALTNQYTMVYSGGTLDADTLDALHAVSFVRADDVTNGTSIDVGRGVVNIENNTSDNDSGAGITLRASSNPASGTNGSIFSVRSSGQGLRLWCGQAVTGFGINDVHIGGDESNGFTTAPLKMDSTNGNIYTTGTIVTTSTLDCENLDVNGDFRITNYNPSEGQVLAWNANDNSYSPITPLSISSLSALSDTNISSPSTGQVLTYNSVSGWNNTNTSWAELGSENSWTGRNTFSEIVYHNNTLDMNNNLIDDAKLVLFYAPYDNGVKSTNWTLSPLNGQYQKVSMSSDNTLSITTPAGTCTIYLHLYQTSTSKVLTLPSGEWAGGVVKTNTGTSGAHDLIMMHYTGAGWVFDMVQDLKTP